MSCELCKAVAHQTLYVGQNFVLNSSIPSSNVCPSILDNPNKNTHGIIISKYFMYSFKGHLQHNVNEMLIILIEHSLTCSESYKGWYFDFTNSNYCDGINNCLSNSSKLYVVLEYLFNGVSLFLLLSQQ